MECIYFLHIFDLKGRAIVYHINHDDNKTLNCSILVVTILNNDKLVEKKKSVTTKTFGPMVCSK